LRLPSASAPQKPPVRAARVSKRFFRLRLVLLELGPDQTVVQAAEERLAKVLR
jgi:hypothetical protein